MRVYTLVEQNDGLQKSGKSIGKKAKNADNVSADFYETFGPERAALKKHLGFRYHVRSVAAGFSPGGDANFTAIKIYPL